ncbi:MAG: hypothetical protein JXB48_24635 [Candidatus Latescibacteria bacterium]|nr:hypothetical protein [Candidatus Latescibacterota bacterium]
MMTESNDSIDVLSDDGRGHAFIVCCTCGMDYGIGSGGCHMFSLPGSNNHDWLLHTDP